MTPCLYIVLLLSKFMELFIRINQLCGRITDQEQFKILTQIATNLTDRPWQLTLDSDSWRTFWKFCLAQTLLTTVFIYFWIIGRSILAQKVKKKRSDIFKCYIMIYNCKNKVQQRLSLRLLENSSEKLFWLENSWF